MDKAKESKNERQYKYIPLLAMLNCIFGIATGILAGKIIKIDIGIIHIACFVSQFWFLENDIIAEVYGYRLAKNFFILHYVIALSTSSILNILIYIRFSESAMDIFYIHLFRYALIIAFIKAIIMTIAWQINITLLLKWKILLKGKYFWLRSVASSGIGKGIFMMTMLLPWGVFPYMPVIVGFKDWLLRLLLTAIFAAPCVFIASFIRQTEGFNAKEFRNDFPILNLKQI